MVELQSHLKEIEATGIQLVGVSYDSPDVLKRAAAKHRISFPLLSDTGSKTIDAYGVRNKEATGRFDGIPHPTTFLVDDQGVIRARLFHDGYKDRHTSEDLIQAVKKLESQLRCEKEKKKVSVPAIVEFWLDSPPVPLQG